MNDFPEILQQLKVGNYKAFNQLYAQYFNLLYGFVLKLTHSHEQTKEIVQETFIKVWLNRDKINPELSFKAWLFKMAQNILVDYMRKQFANPMFEDYLNHSMNEELVVTIQDTMDFDAFYRVLSEAKKKLSPRQLQVFEICKEKGYSSSEAAAELQVTEQTIYNYLHQALHLLRKEIEPFYILFSLLFFY